MAILLVVFITALTMCGGAVLILTGNILANQFDHLIIYVTGKPLAEPSSDPRVLNVKPAIRTIGILLIIIGSAVVIYGLVMMGVGIFSA